jgi:hypothetical protein
MSRAKVRIEVNRTWVAPDHPEMEKEVEVDVQIQNNRAEKGPLTPGGE